MKRMRPEPRASMASYCACAFMRISELIFLNIFFDFFWHLLSTRKEWNMALQMNGSKNATVAQGGTRLRGAMRPRAPQDAICPQKRFTVKARASTPLVVSLNIPMAFQFHLTERREHWPSSPPCEVSVRASLLAKTQWGSVRLKGEDVLA